jgi:hypothetical protein
VTISGHLKKNPKDTSAFVDRLLPRSNNFHDSIENLLKAPNLVVDLRNNEGGAKKQTKKYFKLLKNVFP